MATREALHEGLERLVSLACTGQPATESLAEDVLALAESSLDASCIVFRLEGTRVLRVERSRNHPGREAIELEESDMQSLIRPPADWREDSLAGASAALTALARALSVASCTAVPIFRREGAVYGLLCAAYATAHETVPFEVTLLRLAGKLVLQTAEQAELEDETQRYSRLIDHSPDPIVVVQDGCLVHANPAAVRLAAAPLTSLLGTPVLDLLHPDSHSIARNGMTTVLDLGQHLGPTEHRLRRPNGTWIEAEVTSSPSTFRGRPAIQMLIRDITERKRTIETLRHRALHDPLTNLPNRALLEDRLQRALIHAQRAHDPVAVLLLDLDGFKNVNDTFGHEAGDAILREIAPRVHRVLRESDTVARLGGDEFVIVLPGADRASAELVARKILRSLRQPFRARGQLVSVWASIGIGLFPEHGGDALNLLRCADTAMYMSKRQEGGYTVFPGTEAPLRRFTRRHA